MENVELASCREQNSFDGRKVRELGCKSRELERVLSPLTAHEQCRAGSKSPRRLRKRVLSGVIDEDRGGSESGTR